MRVGEVKLSPVPPLTDHHAGMRFHRFVLPVKVKYRLIPPHSQTLNKPFLSGQCGRVKMRRESLQGPRENRISVLSFQPIQKFIYKNSHPYHQRITKFLISRWPLLRKHPSANAEDLLSLKLAVVCHLFTHLIKRYHLRMNIASGRALSMRWAARGPRATCWTQLV